MKSGNATRQRLIAISLAGLVLLSFPVLGLVQGVWRGIPVPFLYLFGVWSGLLLLAAVVAELRGK